MRLILIFTCLLCSHCFICLSSDSTAFRNYFYKACNDKSSIRQFVVVTERYKQATSPILLCYQGAAEILKARILINPYSKLSSFKKGKGMIDWACARDPTNIEIHYVRFCIQTNAPLFLKYNGEIVTDKTFILKRWNKLSDEDLKKKIKKYMTLSKYCSIEEKAVFYKH